MSEQRTGRSSPRVGIAVISMFAGALLWLLAAPVSAQFSSGNMVYTYENSTSGAIPLVATCTKTYESSGANATITDNAYGGGNTYPPTGMACKQITVASESGCNTIGGPVTVRVPITHSQVGNLVVKLFTPTGNFTLMSRPGTTETDDTGGDTGGGDSSNLSVNSPITFAMAATDEAEDMGTGLDSGETVCLDGGPCSFNPNNGFSTLSENLADLTGDSKNGDWYLCVGDAQSGFGGAGSNGTLGNWTLDLGSISNPPADTCTTGSGLALTFSVPDGYTFNSVSLGLNASHTERGDIRAFLQPPSGSATLLFPSSTDANDDYDVMLSRTTDPTAPPLNDTTADLTTEPYYNRMVYSSVLADAPFTSGSASGTWTLYLCDGDDNSVNGTFNRARLVLSTSAAPANVCTSSALIDWGSNGGGDYNTGADFPGGGLSAGGITMTREAFGSNPNGGATVEANQKTVSTSQFGATLGYYQMRFTAPTTLSAREGTYYWARFRFDPPVRDLQWGSLDVDTGGWEDAVRIYGTDAVNLGGNRLPYAMNFVDAANASFQFAGDFVEADSGNIADAADDGNSFALFKGTVASVRTEYWALDEPTTPNTQRIGISDAQFCAFDFGDAPNTYGTQLSGGARHVLGNRTLYLGTNPPDGESDGAPAAAATTDDTTQISGVDDEDGVASFPAYTAGSTTYTVSVNAVNLSTTTAASLVGYIDWNRDGDFADANEISATVSVPANTISPTAFNVTWNSVPFNAGGTTATYARFRIAYVAAEAQSPTGQAASGEVEDYPIPVGTLPVTIARVESAVAGGQLTVRWTTASETANAGFRIWGREAAGEWTLLAEVPSQQADSFAPQRYTAEVAAAGIAEIKVEDVSLFGERRSQRTLKVGEAFGAEPEAMPHDWRAIRARARLAPAGIGVAAAAIGRNPRRAPAGGRSGLLLVREEGIQRVTYEQLLAAGIDLGGIPPARIAILDGGAAVPRHVQTPGSTFGAGGVIEFYARPALTLASPVDAFAITVDHHAAEPVGTLLPGTGDVAVTTAEDRQDAQKVYSFSAPNGDPWFDKGLLAWGKPASLTRTFDLPNLATGPVELRLSAWGYGDWAGIDPPDHHVVVTLNGNEIVNDRFDGVTTFAPTVDVTDLVHETGNVLEVTVPGDTAYQFDYLAYDGFSVRYPRETVALAGRFGGTVASEGGFAVSGFASGEPVSVWHHDGEHWRRGVQSTVDGRIGVPLGGEVHAAAASGFVTPAIAAGLPEAKKLSEAEYVIVTHPALADSVGDLVALEESRGFTTEVVTVDRIFAAYSDHASSADALKRFLLASHANGTLRYVLLVGSDTSDPYDHLGLGSVSFVPTAYLPFIQFVAYSPTDEALVDADDDGVGEVPIGRLSVRTPAELAQVVGKLRAWEQNLSSARPEALLASGESDDETHLAQIGEAYAKALTRWDGALAAVDEAGTDAVRQAVLAAMSAGTPLVSFVGHSSAGQWDFTPVLRWQDVASFTNSGKPNVVTQWGCWNSYFVEPGTESLSARMLITPDVGVVAAIGATTLTTPASHERLGRLFFAQIDAGARTVGEAFRNAKAALRAEGVAHDASLGMALLGDPATSLPRGNGD